MDGVRGFFDDYNGAITALAAMATTAIAISAIVIARRQTMIAAEQTRIASAQLDISETLTRLEIQRSTPTPVAGSVRIVKLEKSADPIGQGDLETYPAPLRWTLQYVVDFEIFNAGGGAMTDIRIEAVRLVVPAGRANAIAEYALAYGADAQLRDRHGDHARYVPPEGSPVLYAEPTRDGETVRILAFRFFSSGATDLEKAAREEWWMRMLDVQEWAGNQLHVDFMRLSYVPNGKGDRLEWVYERSKGGQALPGPE